MFDFRYSVLVATHAVQKNTRRFGVRNRLHLQSQRIRSDKPVISRRQTSWFLGRHTLRHWRWMRYIPRKLRAFFELHGITTHKTFLFTLKVIGWIVFWFMWAQCNFHSTWTYSKHSIYLKRRDSLYKLF
jgi:hypothetical protein